eukprot:610023-Pleurochrysis_carterae.AAC.1
MASERATAAGLNSSPAMYGMCTRRPSGSRMRLAGTTTVSALPAEAEADFAVVAERSSRHGPGFSARTASAASDERAERGTTCCESSSKSLASSPAMHALLQASACTRHCGYVAQARSRRRKCEALTLAWRDLPRDLPCRVTRRSSRDVSIIQCKTAVWRARSGRQRRRRPNDRAASKPECSPQK